MLHISPERLWRRLGVTAYEDIGSADIDLIALTTAALRGKRFRATLGGESASINFGSDYAILNSAPVSLIGFTAALNYAVGSSTDEALTSNWPNSEREAIAMVAKHIGSNKLNLTPDMLRAKKNPRGLGYFVYSPKTEFAGVKRKVIWFVGNGEVLKLNGPSDLITPNLHWPREANHFVLDGANLDGVDVSSFGTSVAFGN